MATLEEQLAQLTPNQVAEAVKNLGILLQNDWDLDLDDETVKQQLQAVHASGDAEELRRQILVDSDDPQAVERWGRAVLVFAASEPTLRPKVERAVADALASGVKAIGFATLLLIGVVCVALKYRPAKLKLSFGDFKMDASWDENDVSAVGTLAQLAAGIPPLPPLQP